jgi:hypothetical protein
MSGLKYYEACSNKTRSWIVQDGVEVVQSSPHGHPIDAPADGSPPERTPWVAAELLHHRSLNIVFRSQSTALWRFLERDEHVEVTWRQVRGV